MSILTRPIAVACWLLSTLAMSAAAQEEIPISELPPPPDAIERLLRLADVTFTAGPREQHSDASSEHSDSTAWRSLAAETSYRIAYDYRNRSHWKLLSDGSRRRLVITVRFSSVSLKPRHVVWFRRRPETDGFWNHPLVRHELDHVRITSDRRLTRRFEELLRDRNVIEKEIDRGVIVNSELVNRLIEQHVEGVFEEISELASIRYRELDRVTKHGLEPVPESSSLSEWLGDDRGTSRGMPGREMDSAP